MWASFHLNALLSMMTRSRLSRKKTLILTTAFSIVIAAVNHSLLGRFGPKQFMAVSFLCFVLPILIFFFSISVYRDGRIFLTFVLAYGVYTDILSGTNFIEGILQSGGYLTMLLLRLLLFPLIEWVIWKWIREPYLTVQKDIDMDWTTPAVISCALYLALYFMWSVSNTTVADNPAFFIALFLIIVLIPLIYYYIFSVVLQQRELYQLRERDHLLEAEAAALNSRIEQTSLTERQLDIQRHDLHHRFRTLDAMLERKEYEAARNYIASSMETLVETKIPRLCSNPVLDAVFASYFRMAEAEGIQITADLELPEELPVDAAAFSIVVANALENAIYAVRALPEDQRVIRCKCIHFPQFIFRVSNPYAGEIHFDAEGLPIAREGGHGIGTASIQAYCEKYNAICDYRTENGWFMIQIFLSLH